MYYLWICSAFFLFLTANFGNVITIFKPFVRFCKFVLRFCKIVQQIQYDFIESHCDIIIWFSNCSCDFIICLQYRITQRKLALRFQHDCILVTNILSNRGAVLFRLIKCEYYFHIFHITYHNDKIWIWIGTVRCKIM